MTIAELQAAAAVKQANGEAEAIRVTGQAKADAYQAGVNSLGVAVLHRLATDAGDWRSQGAGGS